MTKLTETQQEVYNTIVEQTKYNGFVYLDTLAKNVYGIYKHLSEFKTRSEWRDQFSIKELRKDIVAINNSDCQHKIIPVKHSHRLIGYKVADPDELDKRIKRYRKEALKKWQIANALEVARRNNGQYRITEEDVKEIKTYLGD